MGSKIAKICSIKRASVADDKTTVGSLAKNGYTRQPGAFIRLVPHKEANGKYRTGLDETASYINKLLPDQQKEERERVKALRIELEQATGLELGPRSTYYSGIYGKDYGMDNVGSSYKLKEGDNEFNLEDPYTAIAFYWLAQHPLVAKSYEDYRSGASGPEVQYYVSNPEVENAIVFNENKAINQAIASMDAMTPERRKTVSRLLGLPVSDNDTESLVYNQLDKFLKSGEIKSGEHKGFRAVQLFKNITSLNDEVLSVKAVIKEALERSVYRKVNSIIYEGENLVAESEEVLLKRFLSKNGKNQEEFLALEKKINEKKLIPR